MSLRRMLTGFALFALLLAALSQGTSGRSEAASGLQRRAVVPMIAADSATGSEPSATPGIMQGRWTGTFENTTPLAGNGTFTLDLQQSGQQFWGTMSVTNSPCLSSATISGTLVGNSIDFGVVSGNVTVNYTGTVSGSSAAGSYVASEACMFATGTWSAEKD